MNLLEILGIAHSPCCICGLKLPIKFYDPELGPMCETCGDADCMAEVMLTRTPGICKPTQPFVR